MSVSKHNGLFKSRAYRPLIKHYFEHGARWTAAPKPQLGSQTFNHDEAEAGYDLNAGRSVITEFEPFGHDLSGLLWHHSRASLLQVLHQLGLYGRKDCTCHKRTADGKRAK